MASHPSDANNDCSPTAIGILGGALRATEIGDLSRAVLPGITELVGTGSFLYLSDTRMSQTHYADKDLAPTSSDAVAAACPGWLDGLADSTEPYTDVHITVEGQAIPFTLCPLATNGHSIGLLGLRAGHGIACPKDL